MFLAHQDKATQKHYFELLQAMGSLSRLFSDNSQAPYLHYRSHENNFCRAFKAENLARYDYAVDARKQQVGIGLKTFIHKSSQFEKIAEFNKLRPNYNKLQSKDLIDVIAAARNDRINFVKDALGVEHNIYHCVARKTNQFYIYEVDMKPIDRCQIRLSGKNKDQIIDFSSGQTDYKFNRSKSTLFQKFVPNANNEVSLDIKLLENPYQLALDFYTKHTIDNQQIKTNPGVSHVVLPLYSYDRFGNKYVPKKSGLNQWNAAGRPRHPDEVYIPIPSIIRQKNFFPPRDQIFSVLLPDRKRLQAKVCQDNSKALMSNPNKDLGLWLLRRVLKLKEHQLLTYDRLNKLNIDSVSVEKDTQGSYRIDFQPVGNYEEFIASNVS